MAVRRLDKIIKTNDPAFDLTLTLADLMRSYGRSPYEITLIPGTTYIIAEEKPQKTLELFSELVRHGMEGLCLSRYNPETLRERYNVPEDTVIWLTQKSEPGYRTVDPTNFPRLSSMISDFLGRASYPLILLEGNGISDYPEQLRNCTPVCSVPERRDRPKERHNAGSYRSPLPGHKRAASLGKRDGAVQLAEVKGSRILHPLVKGSRYNIEKAF